MEIPGTLAQELKDIVLAEIWAGNVISQVDAIWPRPGALCVQLKHRFVLKHRADGLIQYAEDNDPHGPVAEYVHTQSGQSVLCSLHGVRP
uniref:ORF90 n=3 Tax=Xanthomonas TaxID=338 RepID=Q5D0M9_XANPE|nr:ORF90 [Xanthomonas perforans]